MSRKKLSLGEKIALAATGSQQDDDFPEDIEYETSAKVIELDEDYDTLKTVSRSSLRTKNIKLLDEYDDRYSGEKVTRRKLANDADKGLPSGANKRSHSLNSSNLSSEEEYEDDSQEDEDEDGSDLDLEDDEDLVSKNGPREVDSEDGEEEEEEDDEDDNEVDEEDDESEIGSGEEGAELDEESEGENDGESGATGVQTLSLRDKQSEIEKGRATLNQIRIWDSLLEVRIRLQKMLLDCNRLPHTDMFEELISDINSQEPNSTFPKVLEKSQEATKTLLYQLIHLQEIMTTKNSETKKAVAKEANNPTNNDNSNDPMNEEITSEEDEDDNVSEKPTRKRKNENPIEKAKKMKSEDFMQTAESSFNAFKLYRNQTIQKWNDKTQFSGGKFNRKSGASQQISTLRQIEQILSNKERLLKRTQIKRSTYSIIGEPTTVGIIGQDAEEEAEDPEVFDDDDFYHQLLRELIERKTCNVNDPVQLSHHWLELQKLRTKLKRKVDTKASKGRKIRYDVQPKLVNFMAPQDKCKMSEAAVKELFGSLFGKTKSSNE